jgi:hypothetical protein
VENRSIDRESAAGFQIIQRAFNRFEVRIDNDVKGTYGAYTEAEFYGKLFVSMNECQKCLQEAAAHPDADGRRFWYGETQTGMWATFDKEPPFWLKANGVDVMGFAHTEEEAKYWADQYQWAYDQQTGDDE